MDRLAALDWNAECHVTLPNKNMKDPSFSMKYKVKRFSQVKSSELHLQTPVKFKRREFVLYMNFQEPLIFTT